MMMIEEGRIRGFKEHHSDLHVDFTIDVTEDMMTKLESEGLEKHFGLIGSCSVSNMVLFRQDGTLKKYSTATDILREWYEIRKPYYGIRKEWLESKLRSELKRIDNKLRFILAVIADELKIRNIKKRIIIEQLIRDGYDRLPKKATFGRLSEQLADEFQEKAVHLDENQNLDLNQDQDDHNENKDDENNTKKMDTGTPLTTTPRDFDYLLSMPLWSLTLERVEQLRRELENKQKDLCVLQNTRVTDLWERDLSEFERGLSDHEERERLEIETGKKLKPKKKGLTKTNAKTITTTHKNKNKTKIISSDSDSDGDIEKKRAKTTKISTSHANVAYSFEAKKALVETIKKEKREKKEKKEIKNSKIKSITKQNNNKEGNKSKKSSKSDNEHDVNYTKNNKPVIKKRTKLSSTSSSSSHSSSNLSSLSSSDDGSITSTKKAPNKEQISSNDDNNNDNKIIVKKRKPVSRNNNRDDSDNDLDTSSVPILKKRKLKTTKNKIIDSNSNSDSDSNRWPISTEKINNNKY